MKIADVISNEELYRIIVEFQVEYGVEYGVNVKNLCEKLGVNLIKYCGKPQLLDISKDGFSRFRDDEYFIFYNEAMPEKRINFTIVHEIGHFIMCHHFIDKTNILRYGKNTLLEKQANTFAQNILMPADKMKTLKNHKLKNIANYFDVSEEMARVRLQRLKEDLYYIEKTRKENGNIQKLQGLHR